MGASRSRALEAPASLELLLPAQSPQPRVALIHIFIRINEACKKCIGEAKQAAERERQWMTAGEEEDKADLGALRNHMYLLAKAAREQRTLPLSMVPHT